MDHLLAELTSGIATFCDRDSIFRLHGDSRLLNNIVSPHAFETFYVG
jgi:hypothetical protein